MKIIIDLDDTLSVTENRDYANAKPIPGVMERVKELRGKFPEAEVWIHTARGMNSCAGDAAMAERRNRATIEGWLKEHGVEVDGIIFGKPLADLYIDDKAMSADEFAGSEIEAFRGLSGARVERIGRMVIKEAENVKEQADWYKEAAACGFSVPKVYCCQLGKLYMEYVGSQEWEAEPTDIIRLVETLRRFADIHLEGRNNIEGYARHCHKRAEEAGEDDGDLTQRLARCEVLVERTFCHGDFSLLNIIRSEGRYTLIDPCHNECMSHWMLDAAKLRASLNWLDYGLAGKRHKSTDVRVFDAMFSYEELEVIKLLEESHYYRVLRYAVRFGRDDVAQRLKEAYGRRIG